jgi:hypothetical protein
MIRRLIIIVIVVLCTNLKSFAQTQQDVTPPDGEATVEIEDENTGEKESLRVQQNQQPQEEEPEPQLEVRHGLALQVLGRRLTQREKASFGGDPSEGELKNNLLSREQRLVLVRALITIGETDIKYVLGAYHFSKLQTYSELVERFSELTEKYGSVKAGIESEYISNIKDDKEAFKKAASKAYETVFGIPKDKQNEAEILAFLTQNKALTYSKMLQVLMQTITPEIKKQILFSALDQVGRADLKPNDKFTKKMLEQDFTYSNLIKLFQKLKQTAPAQPAQGKNLKKN